MFLNFHTLTQPDGMRRWDQPPYDRTNIGGVSRCNRDSQNGWGMKYRRHVVKDLFVGIWTSGMRAVCECCPEPYESGLCSSSVGSGGQALQSFRKDHTSDVQPEHHYIASLYKAFDSTEALYALKFTIHAHILAEYCGNRERCYAKTVHISVSNVL